MNIIRQFVAVYRLYAKHHPRGFALRTAYNVAIRGLPF